MASNRMKQKIKQSYTNSSSSYKQQENTPSTFISSSNQPQQQVKRMRPKIFTPINQSIAQEQFLQYNDLKASNPNGITFSLQSFPCTVQLYNECKLPLAFAFSPLLALQNQNIILMNKNIDTIPRCGGCRAYMNCYNTVQQKKFVCFLCDASNYSGQYNYKSQPNEQRNSSIFQALGSPNCYQNIPSQQCLVLIIDISHQASNCQMLHYASAAIKQVLNRSELDKALIHIFAYSQKIYQFDLNSQQITCVIMDKSITSSSKNNFGCAVQNCRDKIDLLLEHLQDLSSKCTDLGSNFQGSFSYIYQITKGTGAKYFILQASQQIAGQSIMNEAYKAPNKQAVQKQPVPKSTYDTKNRNFFQKFASPFINNANSLSLFVFAKNYKNLRVFLDTLKVANCELKYYSKNEASDLQKFYYEFSYLLGASYFKDTKVQFIISTGFHFTSVYGNSYRVKEHITFYANQLQTSKQYFVQVNPSKKVKEVPLHCTIQCVINYRYKKQHITTVATMVQTLTGSLAKLYQNINTQMCITSLGKSYCSNLRLQFILAARNTLIAEAASIYKLALNYFKTNEKIPYDVFSILGSTLAMLKSFHSIPEIIANSPLFDRICAQRNLIQFCGYLQFSSLFSPYLFDLNHLQQGMCQEGNEFIYPPTVQIKFQNVKQGIFLLDNGLSLYLFIAKNCDQYLMKNLFGKSQFAKQQHLTQQILNQQSTKQAIQIRALIKFLRQQKCYGWIPLYIVRCGENSTQEKNFYLQFTNEKYDEFKGYKPSLQQYLTMLKSQ